MTRSPSHWPPEWNGDLELAFLRRIVQARAPELLDLVEAIARRRLTAEERELLREVVADELQTEGGIGPDGELSEYGNRLDLLIEWLGKVSVWD